MRYNRTKLFHNIVIDKGGFGEMDCEANTFFGVMNAFRGLNVFSLLPLSRQEYMLMFLVFRHRKTNPEGCTVSTLTRYHIHTNTFEYIMRRKGQWV